MNQTVQTERRSGLLRIASLRDFYAVLFRHKLAALTSAALAIGTFGALALLLPDSYRSEARILLRVADQRIDPAVAAAGPLVSVSQSREAQINSELEIMTSEPLILQAAIDCGLIDLPKDLSDAERSRLQDKAMVDIEDALTVQVREESNVVRLAFLDEDPVRAQKFLECLVQLYRDQHVKVHSSSNAFDFLSEQTAELASVVKQRQEALRTAKLATGVSTVEDSRAALSERLNELERTLQGVRAEKAASTAQIAALEAQLTALPQMAVLQQSRGIPNTAFDTLVQRLYELRLERIDAGAKYKTDSRALKDLEEKIADTEALLSRQEGPAPQVVEGVNETYQQLELRLLEERSTTASLEARERTLVAQLTEAEQQRDGFLKVENEIRTLTRDLDLAEQNFDRYADSLEKARIERALENDRIASISVVQAASLPGRPNGPHRLLLLLIGLVAAGFLATGVTFGLEALNDSVRTPDDVEECAGIRPLVTIPFSRPSFRKHRLPGAGHGTIDWWQMPETVQRDYGPLGEAWDLEHDLLDRPRILSVVGDRRGAGATTVAANLAETLASHDEGRVLLVDANWNDPTLTSMLGARGNPGLTDGMVKGSFDGIARLQTPVEGLDLLPAGTSSKKMDRGLDPALLVQELGRIATDYAYVVVDLPAIGDVEAVNYLRERTDGLLLVVEAERTRRQVARYLARSLSHPSPDPSLDAAGEFAVVLNKRRYPIPSWIYDRL